MPLERPTLQQLADRIQQDFASRLPLSGAILRRSVVNVLARVLAGAAHMLHGRLEFLARQLFPDTAESASLRRWAALFGVTPTAASYAHGTVTVTGTDGSEVALGATLVRSDGQRYRVDAAATVVDGVANPTVTALTAGTAATLEAGQAVTFEAPIAGVSSSATVASNDQDGSDPESDEALRVRLKERLAFAPQGGAASDYVAWAKEVPGVTRAWVYPQELGAGTVTVRFVRDDDGGSIIPDAGEVAAVQAHVDEVRPVTAAVTVVAPVASALNFTLHISPDNSTARAAVEAELADMLRRDAEPGGAILLSHVEVAVGAVVDDFGVASPAADVANPTGQISTMGTVTFT